MADDGVGHGSRRARPSAGPRRARTEAPRGPRRGVAGAGRGDDEAVVRTILEEWGDTVFARIALLDHHQRFLSADRRCVIPYRRADGVNLALGSPVGPAALRPRALAEFGKAARHEGREPAFVPVTPADLGHFVAEGFRVLPIGQEAFLDLRGFTLRGNRRKKLRQSVSRGQREGLRFEVWAPPLEDTQLELLRAISDSWLEEQGWQERRFGMGGFEPGYLRQCRAAVVRDRRGHVVAFANLLDGYRAEEGTADLTRHRPGVPPGTMDMLFTGVAFLYRDEGKAVFNMGLASLAGVGEGSGAGILERALRFAYHHGRGGYDFEGIHTFKRKYRPRWEPRYLCYRSRRALPWTLFAASETSLLEVIRVGLRRR